MTVKPCPHIQNHSLRRLASNALPDRLSMSAVMCFILLFWTATGLQARSMIFSDGNGNAYRLGPTILIYEPVTVEKSSSGFYSGGEPQSVTIEASIRKNLIEHADRCLKSTAEHTSLREKGSYSLHLTGPEKNALLKKGSSVAAELERSLIEALHSGNEVPLTYRMDREMNPWSGSSDSELTVGAEYSLYGYQPVAPHRERMPLLYRSEKNNTIVVDAKAFSPLIRRDATRIKPGDALPIGRVLQKEYLSPHILLPFLLKSHIVITYWHTDSELNLTGEDERDGLICYRFQGKHHYYTNQKNTQSLSFAVCIKALTGEVLLSGDDRPR